MNQTIPNTSFEWVTIFYEKAQVSAARSRPRVVGPLTQRQREIISRSLPAWQREKISVGPHVKTLARKHATAIGDPAFMSALELFIREAQRQGAALGEWLDQVGIPQLLLDKESPRWGGEVIRSYASWASVRVSWEAMAETYYAALRRLTSCPRLKAECAQILVDSETRIQFHCEQLALLRGSLPSWARALRRVNDTVIYTGVSVAVWLRHGELFREADISLWRFIQQSAKRLSQLKIQMNPRHYDFAPTAPYEQWRMRLNEVRS